MAKTQLAILHCLVQTQTLEQVQEYIPEVHKIVEQAKRDQRTRCAPVEDLFITQRLSREVDAYKSPSPVARAARQWIAAGKSVAPGRVLRFAYTRGKPGVWRMAAGNWMSEWWIWGGMWRWWRERRG